MSDEKELVIVRGSTPLLVITMPDDIETSDIASGVITISQKKAGVSIVKTLDEMKLEGKKYSVFLKQSETLKLDSTKPAAIQAKFCTIDDVVLVSFIQNIEILPVNNEKMFEQDNPSGDTYEATGESGIEIVPDLVDFSPGMEIEQIIVSAEDYKLLRNKPSINGVVLLGDKTSDEFGIYSSAQVDALLEPIADKEVEQDTKLNTIDAQICSYTLARNVLANEYTNSEIDEKIAGAGDIHALEERIDNQIGTHTVARNVLANEYTNTEIDSKVSEVSSALNNKVDKVSGKGLSTNDYTTAEKTKLANIEAGAQVNTITGVKGDSEASYRTGNVNITKANIGLGNVDNTSDADKPISTAVQTALNGKITAPASGTAGQYLRKTASGTEWATAPTSVTPGSIATIEAAQAVENHDAGDFILLDGQLYEVTAAVAAGETFTEGTNVETASVGDQLTALNNGLMWKPLSSGVDSSVRTSLSSVDYRELLLIARISNAAFTIIALKTEIDAGQTLWQSGVFYRSGTWVVVQFGVDMSNNEVYMLYANYSGTDILASAKYSIYYR